jgi:hypothetical protein
MRQPSTFRAADITRAVKGMRAAGVEVERAEIDNNTGKIVIVVREPGRASKDSVGVSNPWDEVLDGRDKA